MNICECLGSEPFADMARSILSDDVLEDELLTSNQFLFFEICGYLVPVVKIPHKWFIFGRKKYEYHVEWSSR